MRCLTTLLVLLVLLTCGLVLAAAGDGAAAGAKVGGSSSPDGAEVLQMPLPGRFHQRNTGGSDGAGLCVFASMRHSGLWGSNRPFEELFEWMRRHPGGGYPEKVDQMLARFCKEKGYPMPDYLQVQNRDLELLKLAARNKLMPAVTYSKSPTGRYGGAKIAHMVSLVHATDRWFCVLDNNYPGEQAYEWMSPDEFARICNLGGNIWSVILLGKAPPPAPLTSGGG